MLRFTIDEAIDYYNENDIKGEFVIVLEGASKKEEVVEETIPELMEQYMNDGYDKKEAMKLVAKKKEISKSEVYKAMLKEN